jgi:glutamate transport system permease protein
MSTLYDAPGPRARRRALILSGLVALVLIAGGYLLIYRPLAAQGQFTAAKWGSIVDPSDPNFVLLWKRFGVGLRNTISAAGLAVAASLLLGTGLAVLRTLLRAERRRRYPRLGVRLAPVARGLAWSLDWLTRVCVETVRGLPVVIAIFFVARGLPQFGLPLGDLAYIVIGLTVYNGVVIGEILRSGMVGLARGQREAALAIGLTEAQTIRLVLLPQAFRVMLPALVSQVVVVLKDTSIGGVVVGYDELLKVGSLAVLVLHNPIQILTVVAAMYLVMNYSLSRLATYLRDRVSVRSGT